MMLFKTTAAAEDARAVVFLCSSKIVLCFAFIAKNILKIKINSIK